VVPSIDLSLWRSLPELADVAEVAVLLYGLVWETR
jgi:hypothetical protein